MKAKFPVLVVVPSYNESENIGSLIEGLLATDPAIDVLVVDDNSPDGTADIVEKISGYNKRLFLIIRKKKDGRGGAVLDGFRWGLKSKKNYQYFFEMDADFSHKPSEIPAFIKHAENHDVVVGSRYMKGSNIIGWPLNRKVFSKLANIYTRFLLRIPITDYTNGFRLYKRTVLERLNFDAIEKSGYIVLSEIAFQIHLVGFDIGEIPTVFVNRQRGLSNLSISEVTSALHSVFRLSTRRNKIRKALNLN